MWAFKGLLERRVRHRAVWGEGIKGLSRAPAQVAGAEAGMHTLAAQERAEGALPLPTAVITVSSTCCMGLPGGRDWGSAGASAQGG